MKFKGSLELNFRTGMLDIRGWILEVSVFVFHHGRTRIAVGTGDNQSSELVEICSGYRLGERQFTSEDGWYANLICFNVDIGGNN